MYHAFRWTPEKIKQRIKLIEPLVYSSHFPLGAFSYRVLSSPLEQPSVGLEVDDSSWPKISPHDYWGSWMTDFILRVHFNVPADWGVTLPVALYLPLGVAGDFSHPEALAYIDGIPYAACDRHHQEILLWPEWADGQPHLLALHGWTGLGGAAVGDFFSKLYLETCSIVQIHQPTRDLIAVAQVALQTANCLAADDPIRFNLFNALDQAFRMLDTRDPLGEAFYASVPAAYNFLCHEAQEAGAPLDAIVYATGHAHLDVAWLWTLGQTRRKAQRIFYNVVRLMEQFPDYHFSQSQPQLYEFIRQDQPELFETILQRVREGRWEPMGGMWVEADCNLTGAESLVRQLMLGRFYFRQHFGSDSETPVLWLPDVFGYSWALPQLIHQAGLKYFMTIKIGWSQYNRLPYDTFWWQGLDGTRILTHFSTTPDADRNNAGTYNAMATPQDTLETWSNFQQKELHRDLLMAYGFGDGGGGPTREMLENIRLMANFPGLPQMKQSSVSAFFEALEADVKDDPRTPVWNGELYLEYHRGTYTTQSRNKRANRKSEFLLHDAEFLATYASLLNPGYTYPNERFSEAWRTVCLNQFHDIIPGSSINPVYAESLSQYASLTQDILAVRDDALEAISGVLTGDLLIANPTSFERSDLAFWAGALPEGKTTSCKGDFIRTQVVEGGTLFACNNLPAYSVTPIHFLLEKEPASQQGLLHVSTSHLENDMLLVEFNPDGDITRIYDKIVRREVLPSGLLANQFQAFEDRPMAFDAWDIDVFYDDKVWSSNPAQSIRVIESGPLRAAIEIKRQILNSPYIQRICLTYNSPRLDFETRIQWNERHTLLKVAFPVDILSPYATYEIQWGNLQRPTHRNTSWDWARFETCAQKWVDLSEGGYGVSLLNDCKYGHDIYDNVMRISLLRGSTLPDPVADLGDHRFVYSLLPHHGGWDECTISEAYALNDPIIVYHPSRDGHYPDARGALSEKLTDSLISIDAPNIIVETVKFAEDGDGIIVRLYESQRKRGKFKARVAFPIVSAWETNLLEENLSPLSVEERTIHLAFRPFEIKTIGLKLEDIRSLYDD